MQKAILDAFLYVSLLLNGFADSVARLLVSLARLETGHYSSDAFKRHRNAFGMGVVSTRPTTQTGGHANADAGIGHYRTLWGSVRDLRMWFEYWGVSKREGFTPDAWRLYNPAPDYPSRVRATRHQIGRGLSVLAILAPVTLVVTKQILKRYA